MTINLRAEFGASAPTRVPKVADGITYMETFNEARTTRGEKPFTATKRSWEPNWDSTPTSTPTSTGTTCCFKDCTFNQNFNFNMTGGAKKIDYFLNASGLQRERHHAQAPSLEIRHQHQRPEIPVPGQCLGRRHQDHPRIAEDEHPAALPPRPDPKRLGPFRLRHDRHALRIPGDAARRGIGHVRALPEPTTPGTAASSPTPTPSCAAVTATSSVATSLRR